MRGITCTLVVLLALGYIAAHVPGVVPPHRPGADAPHADGWRRTAQGWEQLASWLPPAAPSSNTFTRTLRPWTIALLQLVAALLALRLARPADRMSADVRPPHVDVTRFDQQLRPTA